MTINFYVCCLFMEYRVLGDIDGCLLVIFDWNWGNGRDGEFIK